MRRNRALKRKETPVPPGTLPWTSSHLGSQWHRSDSLDLFLRFDLQLHPGRDGFTIGHTGRHISPEDLADALLLLGLKPEDVRRHYHFHEYDCPPVLRERIRMLSSEVVSSRLVSPIAALASAET